MKNLLTTKVSINHPHFSKYLSEPIKINGKRTVTCERSNRCWDSNFNQFPFWEIILLIELPLPLQTALVAG